MKKEMIKRKDGSYSQTGLWDNIRANRGSGKKPTAQMLKQERKIKSNMQGGGMAPSMPVQDQMAMPQPNSLMSMMSKGGVNNPGFKKLPGYVQAKIKANMQEGGVTGPMSAMSAVIEKSAQPMMQMGGMMPQSTAGKSVLQEAMMMSQMQNGGKMPNEIARARFMAAAKGNAAKAKETASKYGYKMQEGGTSKFTNQTAPRMNFKTSENWADNYSLDTTGLSETNSNYYPYTRSNGTKGVVTGSEAKSLVDKVKSGKLKKSSWYKKSGGFIEHQLGHAGQNQLLSPLLAYKNGGTIKDMYMMKKGGQFPERYKKMGFKGVDQPKKTSSGGKSHAVVTKVDGNYKLIRFGQKGVSGSPEGSARNKAFKARHAKNIAKGKSSAAYWANKVKW
jgi:hypothetical protein